MEGRSSPGVYTLFRSSMCNEKEAVGRLGATWGQPWAERDWQIQNHKCYSRFPTPQPWDCRSS